MPKRYVAYGRGFCGDYETEKEAQAVVATNKNGAIYERLGKAHDNALNIAAVLVQTWRDFGSPIDGMFTIPASMVAEIAKLRGTEGSD